MRFICTASFILSDKGCTDNDIPNDLLLKNSLKVLKILNVIAAILCVRKYTISVLFTHGRPVINCFRHIGLEEITAIKQLFFH